MKEGEEVDKEVVVAVRQQWWVGGRENLSMVIGKRKKVTIKKYNNNLNN